MFLLLEGGMFLKVVIKIHLHGQNCYKNHLMYWSGIHNVCLMTLYSVGNLAFPSFEQHNMHHRALESPLSSKVVHNVAWGWQLWLNKGWSSILIKKQNSLHGSLEPCIWISHAYESYIKCVWIGWRWCLRKLYPPLARKIETETGME